MLLGLLVALPGCGKKDEGKGDKADKGKADKADKVTKDDGPAVPKPGDLPKMPELKIPDAAPKSEAAVKLGHQLFFDERLSVDGTRSCYSCHQNEHGNGGETPTAIGAKEKQLTRHSPVIWNVAYWNKFYWDGRSGSLEAQIKGAWGGGNMGVGADNLAKKTEEIAAIPGYKKQFDEVFPAAGVTPDTIAQAIAAYERTLVCKDTAYDKYAAGDEKALDDSQKAGLALFQTKAQCIACHTPPMFTAQTSSPDGMYYNVGIGTKDVAEDAVDVGRMKVSEKPEDWAAFKIPSLRNVSKSAPYFHDGSVADLRAAVVLMASGGIDNKNKSQILRDLKLSDAEIDALVAFLGALDCNQELEKPTLP